jgi:alcohol dehydrogenase
LESDLATLFVPVSNGISWLRSAAKLRPGESVLVVGVGQHGLATVAAAKRLGAGMIIAAGRAGDERRLEAARLLGADLLVDVDGSSLADAVADGTGGRGVDVTIDAAPLSTTVVGQAVALSAIGGRVIVAGVKNGGLSPIDTDLLHRREITVRGVAARESWAIDAALAWLRAEPRTFDPFGSLKVGLASVTSALLALGGEGGGDRPLHAVVDPRC